MVGFTRMKQKSEEKNSVVGTYADVLKRMAGNYDYQGNEQTREEFDDSHYQMQKRRNTRIDLTTNDKNTTRIENHSEISTITSTTDDLTKRIKQLEEKISESNENTQKNKIAKGKNKEEKISREAIIKEVSTIIQEKMIAFEKKQDGKLAEITKTISTTVSEGIMNAVTTQMEVKFDKYMRKILQAVEKKTDHNTISQQHMQSPPQLRIPPLKFADQRFSYTPQTQQILGGHQELANGPN